MKLFHEDFDKFDQEKDFDLIYSFNVFEHLKDQNKYKVVLLISDGEDHEGNAIRFSNQANELGIDIHTIGIGSDLGGLVPIRSKKNDSKDYPTKVTLIKVKRIKVLNIY